jgi:hypothetical protein
MPTLTTPTPATWHWLSPICYPWKTVAKQNTLLAMCIGLFGIFSLGGEKGENGRTPSSLPFLPFSLFSPFSPYQNAQPCCVAR